MTAPTDWRDICPSIPLDWGCVAWSRTEGRCLVVGWTEHRATILPEGYEGEDYVETTPDDLMPDLSHAQGFGFGLRFLMRRVANEERARREWPEAWRTMLAFWEDYGIVSGMGSNGYDIDRLAKALRDVTS